MNSIIEFLNDLNSDDWKYRKSIAKNISSDLKKNVNRIEKILFDMVQVLKDGSSDQRYWITQILIENNTFFWSMFLLKEIENNYKEKEYCNNIVEILKNHNIEIDFLIYKYKTSNNGVKTYILDILCAYDLTNYEFFIKELFLEKYNLIRYKAIELLKKNISPEKYSDYFLLLDDDDLAVVKRYTELFYSQYDLKWDFNEELIKKMLMSEQIHGNQLLLCKRKWKSGDFDNVLSILEKMTNIDIFYFIYTLNEKELKYYKDCLKVTSDNRLFFFFILVILVKGIKIDIIDILPNLKEEKDVIIEMVSDVIVNMDNIDQIIVDNIFENHIANSYILKNILKIYSNKKMDYSKVIKTILDDFNKSDRDKKIIYINFLTKVKEESVIPFLIERFDDSDWVIRKRCADAVVNLDIENDFIENYLNSENQNIQFWSSYVYINNISDISFNRALEVFERFSSEDIKKLIIRRIARIDDSVSSKFLIHIFNNNKKFKKDVLKSMIFMNSNSDEILSFIEKIDPDDKELSLLVMNLKEKYNKNNK